MIYHSSIFVKYLFEYFSKQYLFEYLSRQHFSKDPSGSWHMLRAALQAPGYFRIF